MHEATEKTGDAKMSSMGRMKRFLPRALRVSLPVPNGPEEVESRSKKVRGGPKEERNRSDELRNRPKEAISEREALKTSATSWRARPEIGELARKRGRNRRGSPRD
jgi:hypothetical protein